MTNIVYKVSLDDLVSGKLKVMESNADRLEKKLQNLGRGAGGAFGPNIARQFGDNVGVSLMSTAKSWGNVAGGILIGTAYTMGKILTGLLESGVKQSLLRTDINTMGGSMGPTLFRQGMEYAKSSMFGTDVFKNMKQMLAFGTSPEKVMPLIKALGEISGGDQGKMGRLTYAANELMAGDMSKMHIRQLMMAGLPAKDLAKALGISREELMQKDGLKKMGITGDRIYNALIKLSNDPNSRFHNRMENMMDTPAGRVTQLKTNWELMKANLGEGILATEGFKKFLTSVTGMTDAGDNLIPRLVELGSRLFTWLSGWTDKIKNWVKSLDSSKIENYIENIKYGLEVLATVFAVGQMAKIATGVSTLVSVFGQLGALATGQGMIGGISASTIATIAAAVAIIAAPAVMYKLGWFSHGGNAARQKKENELMVENEKYMAERFVDEASKFLSQPKPSQVGEIQAILKEAGVTDFTTKDITQTFDEYTKSNYNLLNEIIEETKRDKKELSADELRRLINFYSTKGPGAIKDKTIGGSNTEGLKTEESRVTGLKPTNIYINMDSMVKQLSFHTMNMQENAAEIENIVIQTLSDAINTAQGISGYER